MENITVTTKIWKTTLKKLRMLHALTGEMMLVILERAVSVELEKVLLEEELNKGK